MSEPSLQMTRKNLPFPRVNPQNLRKVRVPLTKTRSQSNLLTPLTLSLLLPLLLQTSARGRETSSREEDSGASKLSSPTAEVSYPKNKKSSTPTLLLAPLARKLSFYVLSHRFFILVSTYLYCCYIDRQDEEELEPEAHGLANTSTSNS
jgi:hypothetical protein